MKRRIPVNTIGIGAVLLLAMPAWGAVFSYDSQGFESVAANAKPPGWWTGCLDSATNMPGLTAMEPVVLTADPSGYGSQSALTTGRGYAANAGVVNYAVPWSGDGTIGHRFTIAHPAWGTNARSSEAWYTGAGGPHTGTYPMDLKTHSMKAEFDLAVRTGRSAASTHNLTFAVQPAIDAEDIQRYGYWFGRGGWEMSGFSVEVDLYINDAGIGVANGYGDPPNTGVINGIPLLPAHTGVNVMRLWDIGGYAVQSLKTNVDQGAAIPWSPMPTTDTSLAQSPWTAPGNNNQPLHFTVFYNDPAHGGAGHVQVYLYVDPATKAAGDPVVPVGQAAYSFGMETAGDPPVTTPKNSGLGELVVDACVGPWPGDGGAVFGFTDGYSGSNHIAQVDNLRVETNVADTSNTCSPSPYPAPLLGAAPGTNAAPVFEPMALDYSGAGVALSDLGVAPIPGATLANLASPGWNVDSYPQWAITWTSTGWLDTFERSIAYAVSQGLRGGKATGEPNIKYWDSGSFGNFGAMERPVPGILNGGTTGITENQWFGIIASGYIYFPPDTTQSNPYPRHYNICVNSDNGARLRINGQVLIDSGDNGVFRSVSGANLNTFINAGYYRDLTVNAPGVYAIELEWQEFTGGAYVEFYRRTDNPMAPYLPIGSSKCGFSDQPLVFGTLNQQRPPLVLSDGVVPWNLTTVNLDAGQRIGDVNAVNTAAGHQVFNIKVANVPANFNGTGLSVDDSYAPMEDRGTNGLRYANVLDGLSGLTKPSVIHFGNNNYALCMWPTNFPGLPAYNATPSPDNFICRAEGYAVFPHAGDYYLGVYSDDESRLTIGNQVVFLQYCCPQPHRFFHLVVPVAGTYPLRLEMVENGGGEDLQFFELTPDAPAVLVNGPGSTIKVYDSLASGGTFSYPSPASIVIPGGRKVANAGQGNHQGWNAKFAKMKAAYGAFAPTYWGEGTALVENSVYVPALGEVKNYADTSTATVQVIDFMDPSDPSDATYGARAHARFTFDQAWGTVFGAPALADSNNNFAASFSGYIEFPTAGDYMFNLLSDNAGAIWIAGKLICVGPYNQVWDSGEYAGGPIERDMMSLRVEVPGLYDIRVDYAALDKTGVVELVEYHRSGVAVTPNDGGVGVKVYRDLTIPAPLTSTWANPTVLPASAKVAPISRGGDAGVRVQLAVPVFQQDAWNDSSAVFGAGHDDFRTTVQVSDLLDGVLEPTLHPTQAINYNVPAATVYDKIYPRCQFGNSGDTFDATWPAIDSASWYGGRVTGVLALKKGGHILDLDTDDGSNMWIGGHLLDPPVGDGSNRYVDAMNINYTASGHGVYISAGYVYAPEDGLYPFQVDWRAGGSPNACWIQEGVVAVDQGTGAISVTWVPLNATDAGTGLSASKVYANVTRCGIPYVNNEPAASPDNDVDQADFAIFQACFTGAAATLTWPCTCYDLDRNGAIDGSDFSLFMDCWTGPSVVWTASTGCPN